MAKIRIIGVPMDLGQGRRGVDMGPSALRVAGLNTRIRQLGHTVEDYGNVSVKQAEEQHFGDKRAKFLAEISESCRGVAEIVGRTLEGGALPIVLGGDHSIAIGSSAGVSAFYRKQGQTIGLVWVDAHGDMNTPETSPSGNVHGMPLACTLGYGPQELTHLCGFAPKVPPAQCAIVGVRNLDAREKKIVKESGVRVFTMRDIDEYGMRTVMEQAIRVAANGTAGFVLSLDLDMIDPADAPGVGTPVRGGATYREAHLAMEMVADSGKMLAMEVVEINPVIDVHNKTAVLAVELVLSALGKKIL